LPCEKGRPETGSPLSVAASLAPPTSVSSSVSADDFLQGTVTPAPPPTGGPGRGNNRHDGDKFPHAGPIAAEMNIALDIGNSSDFLFGSSYAAAGDFYFA
jgi:hypothetical protein